MNRAIDTGYGWTKFTTGDATRVAGGVEVPTSAFQSLPFEARGGLDAAGMERRPNTIALQVDGVNYVVSDDPAPIAPQESTRVRGDKYTESSAYGICMAAAVKKMGIDRLDNLVVGTPVGNFDSAKAALHHRYNADIIFDDQRILIKRLHVIAQPVGGLVWHYLSNGKPDLNRHPRLLVDVGYGTLDWVAAQGLTTNIERSGSRKLGVFKFVEKIAREVAGENANVSENLWLTDAIDKLLSSDKTLEFGGVKWQRHMFAPILEKIAVEGVQQIIASAGDVRMFTSVVVMGGGGHLYVEALKKAFAPIPIDVVPEARFANVRGFQLIAEHQGRR